MIEHMTLAWLSTYPYKPNFPNIEKKEEVWLSPM